MPVGVAGVVIVVVELPLALTLVVPTTGAVGVVVAATVVVLPATAIVVLVSLLEAVVLLPVYLKLPQLILVPFLACTTTLRFPKNTGLLGSVLRYRSRYCVWEFGAVNVTTIVPCLPERSPTWQVSGWEASQGGDSPRR